MSIVSEPLGRVLGNRYRLVAGLGSGASAHVFLAEDMVLQRRVAVKVLQPQLVRDEAFLRRFRAEARSVAALNHPHVLRVFDWGEGEDGPYLVLEYLEGGSLFDMIARGRKLSPGQAARIGAQAAEGLAYAHARGIVHRDVKPANILFDEEGRVRVADFGVARALASASTTDPGTMLGTARYASPEQARGLLLDGRSDVYSLGLVLYEALVGTVPFTRETPHATLQARIGERVPVTPELGVLGPVLAEACNPRQEARPHAAELARRLAALAEELPPSLPLPLVRRGAVAGATLGAKGAADLTAGAADDELTLVAHLAATTGQTPGAAFSAGERARIVHEGLADTGEPTATIRMGAPALASTRTSRRRYPPRRWPWVVALLVIVACVLAAGGVYVAKSKLLTASHQVPKVLGETVASARRALLADHFVPKVDAAVSSTKVAAGKIVRQIPGRGVSLKEGSTVQIVPSRGEPSVRVPSLATGIDCKFATRLLEEANLKARCPALLAFTARVPQGDVINWSYDKKLDPKTAPYGSTILVAVSRGPPPVRLPPLAGETYTQAAKTLSADGFVVKEAGSYSTTVPAGLVISTTPGAGASLFVGSSVTVTVSNGPQVVTVPTTVGDTVSQATAAIQSAGLTVSAVYGPGTGVVFTTDPLAGQTENVGTTVVLYTEQPPSTGVGGRGSRRGTPASGSATPASGQSTATSGSGTGTQAPTSGNLPAPGPGSRGQ